MSLSSKIEELQRRWRTEQWENDRPYNPIGAAGVCADELTPLLELTKEMERIGEKLARSLGHSPNCPNLGRPCNCGSKGDQADALTEYERWKRAAKGGASE